MCNLINTYTRTHTNIEESTSPTQSSERKTSIGARSPLYTYSLLSLAMSTYGEADSDVHALVKKLAIRRVEHRSKIHSDESHHIAEGNGSSTSSAAILFSFQQTLPFHTRHHLGKQGVALEGAPDSSVRKARCLLCTEGKPGPRGRKTLCIEVSNRSEGRESERGQERSRGRGRGHER